MPQRYALAFAQPDGVNGAVRLVVFDDHASYWVALDLGEVGFVAIRHDHVSRPRDGALFEVRAEGLWAELVCEVADVHWTFGLEAFGLRLDDRDEALTADVGERVPVGFDLEWDEGQVLGEILLGRSRIPFDGTCTFEHVADDSSVTDGAAWADWLEAGRLPG
jgi:hypothetical protein